MKRKGKDWPYPIRHWSYSSLMSYLRNPLAWQKRYVEGVYDLPSTPSSFVGRAGHTALEHFYSHQQGAQREGTLIASERRGSKGAERLYGGIPREDAVALGLAYLTRVSDFEIDFGKAGSVRAKKAKRREMESDYLQAIGFYLDAAPKYKKIIGVEVVALAKIKGLPIPLKAISDLVVEPSGSKGPLDIVDHKFVNAFSPQKADKPLFILQALFNYYTVLAEYKRPVRRFILQECRKTKNRDGSPQLRRYVLEFDQLTDEFDLFHRLLRDASKDIATRRLYLPNPSDMFEGKNSFDIYKMQL